MSKQPDAKTTLNRRNALKTTGAVTFGGVSISLVDPDLVQGLTPEKVEDSPMKWSFSDHPENMFPLSVASGGPTSSGAILWTKISSDKCGGTSSKPAHIQVATDSEFDDVIYEGQIKSQHIKPETNHVIKVDLDGKLTADGFFYFRFQYDGITSQTGRFRTLPKPDASPEWLRIAAVCCQKFQAGYYPAYNYIAEADVDFIIHLGDQIYESADKSRFKDRSFSLPSGHAQAWNLEDYRHLWNVYRGDPFFQNALEQHTLIPTWDDHETVNNPFWDYENDRPWSDDHPKNDDDEFMIDLFTDSIKAWWEYNPARVEYNPNAEHLHEQFHMWRSIKFGDLFELAVTDERLFRSMPPGGDGAGRRQGGTPPAPPEVDDGDRTMLGFEQRDWFLDTLLETDATWKSWANEVPFSPIWRSDSDNEQFHRDYDNWDGYEHERREIVGRFAHLDLTNYVALTGDMHNYMVSYVLNDWEAVENRTPIPRQEELVGIELMAPALSSDSDPSNFWGRENPTDVESESAALTADKHQEVILEENPHIEWFDSQYNGYAIAEFTPEMCTWKAYAVDDTVNKPDAQRSLLREYQIPEGKVELTETEANEPHWST